RGYVTTRSDPQRRPTVIDLLTGVRDYVFPVGRLDYDSEGLLILTNDGALAAQLTHPRYHVARVYEVRVLGVPDAHDLNRLATGVILDDRKTGPSDVRLLSDVRRGSERRDAGHATLLITVREGRNRQVRRSCEREGHSVTPPKPALQG